MLTAPHRLRQGSVPIGNERLNVRAELGRPPRLIPGLAARRPDCRDLLTNRDFQHVESLAGSGSHECPSQRGFPVDSGPRAC